MATVVEKKSREEEILSEIGASIDASIDRMTPKNLKRHAKHAARIRKVAAARRSKLAKQGNLPLKLIGRDVWVKVSLQRNIAVFVPRICVVAYVPPVLRLLRDLGLINVGLPVPEPSLHQLPASVATAV